MTSTTTTRPTSLRIVVVGCAHGELDQIYESCTFIEAMHKRPIDLLICCGDFQSLRNTADLSKLACPDRYKKMGSFYKYYSGQKKAPVLTVFIGGNHEATPALFELPYGGWVCDNIYYLGFGGVINFSGLRIGGVSGIYKSFDYNKPHFEQPPFDDNTMRSFYHLRQVDIERLSMIKKPLDIFLSHDWPKNITQFGNEPRLLATTRNQKFVREVNSRVFGNPALKKLLNHLKPSYWFCAHMHIKFAAIIPHKCGTASTKFLALDKVMRNRDFLQVLDIGVHPKNRFEKKLYYDPEWLSILCGAHLGNNNNSTSVSFDHFPLSQLVIPKNFSHTVLPYGLDQDDMSLPAEIRSLPEYRVDSELKNPQTAYFLRNILKLECPKLFSQLGIDNNSSGSVVNFSGSKSTSRSTSSSLNLNDNNNVASCSNAPPQHLEDEEIILDDFDFDDDDDQNPKREKRKKSFQQQKDIEKRQRTN